MRERALQFLACPRCRGALTVAEAQRAGDEIVQGRLACEKGCGWYPVDRGVPRLLPELCRSSEDDETLLESQERQEHAQRGFGLEWRLYRYGDTTWGVTVDERIVVALHELGWSKDDLPGKAILDAGCGNGTLSAALVERGAEVVGVDLSDSVFRAHEHCGGPRMHFVQGNLFFPPLRDEAFDAIYSCGVFHHTPDTRRCFDALVPTLKHDARSRFFVWLYAKRSPLFNVTVEPLMKLTRRLPGWVLAPVCVTAAPAVEGVSRVLGAVGLLKDVPRSITDRAVILHDLLSPQYVRYHTTEQCRSWAKQAGLTRIEQTLYRTGGNGDDRRKEILEKYWRVCRPGFGILARYPQEVGT